MALSVSQAAGYARAAGFSGDSLVTILAIAMAESGLEPGAQGWNGPTSGCPSGSVDRGLLQINSCYWPQFSDAQCYDPAGAFRAGWTISRGGTQFGDWATYVGGQYLAYVGQVRSQLGSGADGGAGATPTGLPKEAIAFLALALVALVLLD